MSSLRPALSAVDWTELNKLLAAALELELRARTAWLQALPAQYQHLRGVLSDLLLKADELEQPENAKPATFVARVAADALVSMRRDRAGDLVGHWRLVRLVAEGGMGSVWLAERADGVIQRKAALKLPRAEWIDSGLSARIGRERSILARLQHPNIAVLYDAGATAEGRPYLAMEFVTGEPIDTYCAASSVAPRRILEIFVRATRAVAYAHSKLVIHRDIKPSNVLVSEDGAPKLLDFGISKLIAGDGESVDKVALTRLSDRPLTLPYAAPEQILGREITVTTDVYALGALLFELMTGRRPFEGATVLELEQAIVNGDLPRPSGVTADPIRAKTVRGDLDAIIQKAMSRNPEERYQTAAALADDVDRYLAAKPVEARPDSAAYRIRKYIWRHRAATLAVAVAVASLLGGAALALWQASVAQEQAAEAASLNAFVLALIKQADPNATAQTRAADVAMLSAIEQHIDDHYKPRPERALNLRLTIGDAYLNRGEGIAAQRVFRKAADEASTRVPPEDLRLLTAQVRAADSRLLVSRESTVRLDSAIERLRAVGPAGADLLIDALLIRHELGHAYGVPEFTTAQAAFATLDEAMGLATRHFGVGSRQHLRVAASYSQALDLLTSRAKANQLAEEALEAARMRGEESTNAGEYRALQIQRLANSCSRNKDAAQALPALWAIAGEARQAHGENSSQLEEALGAMHSCYLSLLDPSGYRVADDAAFQVAARRENPPSPMLLRRAERSLLLATDSVNSRDYEAAERYARSAEENSAAIIDPDLRHRRLRYVHMAKVCVLAGQGKGQAALEFSAPLRTELDAEFAKVGRVTQWQSTFFRCVSFAQRQLGLLAEAKQTAQVFIDRCKAGPTASDGRCEAKLLLPRAEAEVDGGEYEAALLSLQERRKQPRGTGVLSDHPLTGGRALLGLGRVAEALPVLQFAYGAWLASPDPRGHYAAEAEYWLALAYLANHDTRGRWMLAEARKTLATSPLQHHRNLASRRVPDAGAAIPKPATTTAVPASVAF